MQDGDIVLLDTVAQTRRALTRTTAAEGNPRWAKNETHVTFTRENSLYLLSLTAQGDGLVQLTDAGPRRPDPKPTASQQFLKDEERALLEAIREDSDKEKKTEEKRKREALPRIDLTERQSVTDLALAHGDAYVYALVVERAQNAKRAIVPDYVTVSGYTEDLPARTKVGDTQDTRRLAIVNLKTKALTWASLDVPGGSSPTPQTTEPKPGAAADGRFRTRRPVGIADRSGRRAGRAVRAVSAGRSGAGQAAIRAATARRTPPRRCRRDACSAGACRSFPPTDRWRSRPCAPPTTTIAGSSRSIPPPARRASSITCATTRGCARAHRRDGSPMARSIGICRKPTGGCTCMPSTWRRPARRRSS